MSKRNVYLMQVHFAVNVDGDMQYWLPYSIARLIASAKSVPELDEYYNFEMLFLRENPEKVLASLDNPAVFGCSMYVWNKNYHLTLARMVKSRWPECVIVFGGPSAVPEHLEQGICDVYIDGEGELMFAGLLTDIMHDRPIKQHYEIERIKDLDTLASPYLTGVFDPLIKKYPDVKWQATLEGDRGCPYQCTFCDWGGLTQTKIRKFGLENLEKEIEWLSKNNAAYIMFANGNFGIFPDRDIYVAKLLREYANKPGSKIERINLQYLKNNTETAMIIEHILGDLCKGITLSKQSDSPEVLAAIKRKNISAEKYSKMIEIGNNYNIITYTELILPLPLETLESFKKGLTNCLESGQHKSMDLWPGVILPKSEMGDPEYMKKYGLKTIVVKNYSKNDLTNEFDYNEGTTVEDIHMICETSTMTTEEVLEAYAFIWVVNRMHFCGYSQIISRYLNSKHKISYLNFYEAMYEHWHNDKNLRPLIDEIKWMQRKVLVEGSYPDKDEYRIKGLIPFGGPHWTSGIGRVHCNSIKEYLMDTAIAVGNKFHMLGEDVCNFQKTVIYDEKHTYPTKITCDHNLFTHVTEPTEYIIENELHLDNTKTELLACMRRRDGYRCFYNTPERKARMLEAATYADERAEQAISKAENTSTPNIIEVEDNLIVSVM